MLSSQDTKRSGYLSIVAGCMFFVAAYLSSDGIMFAGVGVMFVGIGIANLRKAKGQHS